MLNQETIDAAVKNLFRGIKFTEEPSGLYDPLRYMISIGGKRIRPTLCLIAYSLYKDELTPEILEPAAGIEVFHSFTLIHDDIMDRSPLRRGVDTVWKKWDSDTAILSGDVMCIDSYARIAKAPHAVVTDVMELFSKTSAEVCEGQQMDMDFETRNDVTTDQYLEMIRLKTAVLLAASLKIGALVGGANAQDTQALYDFGIKIGLAFQLQDDLLDSFGDQATFGKAIGGDIMENKKTYLLLTAMDRSDSQQRKELLRWLGATVPNKDEKIQAVKKIFEATGARDVVEAEVENLFKEAMSGLREMEITAEGKRYLIDYANKLFKRNK